MVELELLQQKMAETYNYTKKMQFTISLLIEILGNFFLSRIIGQTQNT